MSRFLVCLSFLLIFGYESHAVDPNCNFELNALPGRTYHIASPNYPNNYSGTNSCQWNIRSSNRIHLNCEVFDIPTSNNCYLDQVLIYLNLKSRPLNLCGKGTLSRDSDGNEIKINFQSVFNTPGGRFSCTVQAINTNDNNCRCGWKKPTRIYGGQETEANEYPMMAGIVDATIVQVFCGGTIISQFYVLSAAHCLVNRQPSNLGVLIGDHNISVGNETNASLLRVANYIIHPNYIRTVRNSDNDIAIVIVATAIRFTNEIGPACLPFYHSADSFSGAPVTILGWGTTEYAGSIADVLQEASVSVINLSKCQQTYTAIGNNQLCTYTQGKDACQFDSGGPVLWQNPKTGRIVSVGIIDYGVGCGTPTPSVNTRVGAYINWIASVTPDANYCVVE